MRFACPLLLTKKHTAERSVGTAFMTSVFATLLSTSLRCILGHLVALHVERSSAVSSKKKEIFRPLIVPITSEGDPHLAPRAKRGYLFRAECNEWLGNEDLERLRVKITRIIYAAPASRARASAGAVALLSAARIPAGIVYIFDYIVPYIPGGTGKRGIRTRPRRWFVDDGC